MRDDQLRTVLHQQHHTVAALHTQALQIGGKGLCLCHQLRIAGLSAKEADGSFAGIAARAGGQVVRQSSLRRRNVFGQALGPKTVMRFVNRISHACPLVSLSLRYFAGASRLQRVANHKWRGPPRQCPLSRERRPNAAACSFTCHSKPRLVRLYSRCGAQWRLRLPCACRP